MWNIVYNYILYILIYYILYTEFPSSGAQSVGLGEAGSPGGNVDKHTEARSPISEPLTPACSQFCLETFPFHSFPRLPLSRLQSSSPESHWVENKEMLFLKNSHTNNLITPALGFIQQTSSARGKKKALYAHSHGTAARRKMVFNSLWNIQQWLHCTFKSLLIVKPTENSPSCVLKSSFPTISPSIQRSEKSV